jgi:predicted metal-dependent hydrolase
MSQKVIWLDGVGEITLAKRKGTKNIRLSITAAGKIRVGLPYWLPYAAGSRFAYERRDWIKSHQSKVKTSLLSHGLLVGKSYRVDYTHDPTRNKTYTSLRPNSIKVVSALAITSPVLQKQLVKAAERALKKEAEVLLPNRLKQIAQKNNFEYKRLVVKKMTSRWGSCSSDKVITLNYFLMQLPWHLIDYVLIHELIHTEHLNHSAQFWTSFEKIIPHPKKVRKELRAYRPILSAAS